MLRTLLGVVVLLALPALLNAQAPRTSNAAPGRPGLTHGIATQVQGEVVMTDEMSGPNHQEGLDEANGENNQEGVEEADGPNDLEGVDEPGGPNDELGNQAGQDEGGQDEGSTPAPATGNSRVGRHQP
ncbi:MAG: hypothetical protein M3R21_00770 [Candidatus Dormibacteraeota bacterium]|nr:hypothetical protein [Candidatus Dormibacteraeota bacterium]